MRDLLLLRHAKSDRQQLSSGDISRPLNKRGRGAALRVGNWMKRHRIRPQWVICSTALRTRETLDLMRSEVNIADELIAFDKRAYLADVGALLAILARCPEDMNNILVIGHNPGMEQLLDYLCGPKLPLSEKGKLMPAGTLAQVSLPDDWRKLAPGSGKLARIIRPEDIA
jgi:phosphohistidine phosphatase